MYDFLIVGSGLAGSTIADLLKRKGYKIAVIEKKKYVGGSIRTVRRNGIDIHLYGAHIFHTSDKKIYDYFSSFSKLNDFINSPLAFYKGKYYHLPFNMNTFHDLWNVSTEKEAREIIEKQIKEANIKEITNLEQQAISLVGKDVYEILVKGYTEKQWGRKCTELDPSIIRRLPLRFTFDNNYFNDTYQGIPVEGYTSIIKKMLEGIDVYTSCDFLSDKERYMKMAKKVIYTGRVDALLNYKLGRLDFRSLRFETSLLKKESYQESAVVNYTDIDVPYTRIIEHKKFLKTNSKITYITREYPLESVTKGEPYYPINDEKNMTLYRKYVDLLTNEKGIILAGRLGMYKYMDMDDVISSCFDLVSSITSF